MRGAVAVAGVGETTYYKRGQAPVPEFVLAIEAVEAACQDAGIDVKEVDGFSSYSMDRNTPSRLASALGTDVLRYSTLQWESGGGGVAGAVGNAAAAVATGMADCVVVFRALAQGQFGRFGQGRAVDAVQGEAAMTAPYGLFSPAQMFAMRSQRFYHEYGISPEAQKAVAMAAYHHAQNNPRAVMRGKPLSAEKYDGARWIVEPYRLYDCCQENDGAAAMVLVPAERAKDLPQPSVFVLGSAMGGDHRSAAGVHNAPKYGTAGFSKVAERMWQMSGVGPDDVDVVQSYENFTGGVVMSLIEHGLVHPDEANEFFTFENLIAPNGKMPLNTSGGNLAECYMHGLGLQIEAVRQLRGQSCNQVADPKVALASGGPMVPVVSTTVYGTEETRS